MLVPFSFMALSICQLLAVWAFTDHSLKTHVVVNIQWPFWILFNDRKSVSLNERLHLIWLYMTIQLGMPLLSHYVQDSLSLRILHTQIRRLLMRSLVQAVSSFWIRSGPLYSWETWILPYFAIRWHIGSIAFLLSQIYSNNETVHGIITLNCILILLFF